MITQDEFKEYAEHIKEMAGEQLADGGQMHAAIGVWIDMEPILWVFPNMPPEERAADSILMAARACIMGIGADSITIANDTMQAHSMVNAAGKEWEPGEMQRTFEKGLPGKELLSEAVMVQYYDRLGDSGHALFPYDRSSGPVVFGEQTIKMDDAQFEGYLPETIREFFKEPTLLDTIKSMAKHQEDLDLDVEAQALGSEPTMPNLKMALEYWDDDRKLAFLSQLCAVIKYVLMPMKCSVAVAIKDKESAEYLQHSLGLPDLRTEDL